jgi:predicted metal-dependent peptidase
MKEHINLSELIDKALGSLTMTSNTYAYLISRIGINIVNEPRHYIAATDGKSIYFNQYEFDWLNEKETLEGKNCKLTKDNLIFIMCHELMHLLTETFVRGKALGVENEDQHDLWNRASDYEINWMLHNNRDSNGHSLPLGKKPEIGLYDEKYANKTAEEIYEILKKEQEKNKSGGGFNRDNNSSGGLGNGDKKAASLSGSDGKGGLGGSGQEDENTLSGHQLDRHLPIDEMTANKLKGQIEEILQQVKTQGLGDKVLERIYSILFKPVKFDWRRALSRYFKTFLKGNYTWNKPSRSGIATGLRLPAVGNIPMVRVGVALDTSGSISDNMLQKLMRHIFTILTQVKQYEVYAWCVSTEVHENTLVKYTPSNKNTIKDFKFESTGGTDLRTTFPFIEKEFASKPLDVLIYMTDGYDSLDGDTTTKVPYPVVWLIIDNKDFKKPARIKGAVYPIED